MNGAPGLGAAAEALAAGLVVAIPTDTVYGLAVDPVRSGAVAALRRLKQRPDAVAVAVLVSDPAQAGALAAGGRFGRVARILAERFWPGKLTLVVPRSPDLAWDLGGDDATVGIRCPDHSAVTALCSSVGPVATTSANRHGEAPLTTAAEVVSTFGQALAAVVDGGICSGAPSTVVDCTGADPTCLRHGAVPWADIEAVLSGR